MSKAPNTKKHSLVNSLIRGFSWKLFQKIIEPFKKNKKWESVPSKYYGTKILSPEESNDFIRNSLASDSPVFIGRYGDVELKAVREYLEISHKLRKSVPNDVLKKLSRNAGMFSNDSVGFDIFVHHILSATSKLTGLCCWGNVAEDYVVKSFGNDCSLLNLDGLEGFRFKKPWMSSVAGKKVLVIHPFAESVANQYTKRTKLFSNCDNLPSFTLLTLKAVQTMAGEKTQFKTWEEALFSMEKQCEKIDYDVAIIGCGAYGLPLGELLFKKGKKVIHAGGVTQILFGITGSRWEQRGYMAEFINQYWSKPASNEKPINASSVENGCYW